MGFFVRGLLLVCLTAGSMVMAANPAETEYIPWVFDHTAVATPALSNSPAIPGLASRAEKVGLLSDFLLLSRTTSDWQNQNWMGQSRASYVYNSRNQIFRETYEFYYAQLDSWIYNYRVTFYYDSEHRVNMAVADYWNGMAWMWHSNTEITYDSEGHMIEQYQEGSVYTLQTYTYDGEGRMIEFVLQRTDDPLDPWENYIRYLYSYEGASIYPSENIQQEGVGGEWINRDRFRFTYHNFGMYEVMYHDTWAGQEWSDYAQSFHTYGDNDWLDEILYQRWYSNAWHDDTKTVFTRDAHGNALAEVTLDKMTGDWEYATRIDFVWQEVTTDAAEAEPYIPGSFSLEQNHPNPFNAATAISFTLPARQDINIRVFNILGQEVVILAEGSYAAGEHTIIWDGNDQTGRPVSSGIYFYKIETAEKALTRKMVLLK